MHSLLSKPKLIDHKQVGKPCSHIFCQTNRYGLTLLYDIILHEIQAKNHEQFTTYGIHKLIPRHLWKIGKIESEQVQLTGKFVLIIPILIFLFSKAGEGREQDSMNNNYVLTDQKEYNLVIYERPVKGI